MAVRIQKLSEIIDEEVSLRVCSSTAQPTTCLRWQPTGSLVFSEETGVISQDKLFLDKARSMVELVREKNVDLLLVPEYSIPQILIDEIVSNKSKWPRPGALWCLAAQGEQVDSFNERLSKWEGLGAKIHGAEIRHWKNFVCPLVYMFVSDSGETLYLVIQNKMHSSSDRLFEHEGPNLSLGQDIFVFDLDGQAQAINYFFSIICADILCKEYSAVIQEIEQQRPNNRCYLVFHPQLNPKPRHESFIRPRNNVFNDFPKKVQLLTLNWAYDTTLDGKPSSRDPWSCFYSSKQLGFSESTLLRQIGKNHRFGVFFARHRYRDIWYSLEREHISICVVPHGHIASGYDPVAHSTQFIATDLYFWNNSGSSWVRQNEDAVDAIISEDIEQQLEQTHEAYRFPLETDALSRDFLFGVCRGSPTKEFESDWGEKVVRTQWSVGEQSRIEREGLFRAYNAIVSELDKGNLPPGLRSLNEGVKPFVYVSNKKLDELPPNLYPKSCVGCSDCDGSKCEYRGIVTITSSKTNIDMEFNKIKRKVDILFWDKIVLYYQTWEDDGIKFFSKHLSPNYTRGERIKNLTSIRNI